MILTDCDSRRTDQETDYQCNATTTICGVSILPLLHDLDQKPIATLTN